MSLNFQSAKIFIAATEASAPGPTLYGAHVSQDLLEHSVTKVSNTSKWFDVIFWIRFYKNYWPIGERETWGATKINLRMSTMIITTYGFRLQVNVPKTRVKMAVHVVVKTSVNVHLFILVLSAQEKYWEPKTTQHQKLRWFLTPTIV